MSTKIIVTDSSLFESAVLEDDEALSHVAVERKQQLQHPQHGTGRNDDDDHSLDLDDEHELLDLAIVEETPTSHQRRGPSDLKRHMEISSTMEEELEQLQRQNETLARYMEATLRQNDQLQMQVSLRELESVSMKFNNDLSFHTEDTVSFSFSSSSLDTTNASSGGSKRRKSFCLDTDLGTFAAMEEDEDDMNSFVDFQPYSSVTELALSKVQDKMQHSVANAVLKTLTTKRQMPVVPPLVLHSRFGSSILGRRVILLMATGKPYVPAEFRRNQLQTEVTAKAG
jgi:hypothetical protein